MPGSPRARWVWALLGVLVVGAVATWRMPEVLAWWWYARSGGPQMTTTALELVSPLRWFDDYYAVADLGEGAYAIGEPRYGQCNFSYLVVGSERAVLFDTGPGLHDITAVVRTLTTLPVTALPSHLHFDHVGNLARFARVALPDLPQLRAQAQGGRFRPGLYQYLGIIEHFARPRFTVSDWIAPGAFIDLGGRRLELLSVPGHTPESVVLYDPEANRLFAGDFIYPSSIYAFLPGADLAAYADSARRVAQRVDEATRIHGAHGCDPLPRVEVPVQGRADVIALGQALAAAAGSARGSGDWYPRRLPVNGRMTLLAKYPWMRP